MKALSSAITTKTPYFILGVLTLALTSCATYTNTVPNDGIYQDRVVYVDSDYEEEVPTTDKNNYYQQYFSTKANNLPELPEEDVVFTDIEAYSTTEYMDEDGYAVVQERDSFGGWGTNGGGDVIVNVYDNGWGFNNGFGWGGNFGWGGGFGWGGPWGFNSFWGRPHWGAGWGWGAPWGWNNPWAWNAGWGWGGGFYGPGWGWGNNWNNHTYFGTTYAFNDRGRSNLNYSPGRTNGRNGYTDGNRSRYNQRGNSTRGSYDRSRTNSRNTRSVRPGSSRTYERGTQRRTVRPQTNTQRSNSRTIRNSRSGNSRGSSPTTRRSSPSRSSGTMRSGGGSRSSGGMRSGGGRSGGRGGRG